MENSKIEPPERSGSSAVDDMEQVRQLLIGDHQAEQERQISGLQARVVKLERLVEALITHGDISRRAWQAEVAAFTDQGPNGGGNRAVTQHVTLLTRKDRDPGPQKDD